VVGPSKLTGVGASEGVAVGPVFAHAGGELEPERETIPESAVQSELDRFRRAVEAVVGKLTEAAERLSASGTRKRRRSSRRTLSWPRTPSSQRGSRSASDTCRVRRQRCWR
jgi:phosphoenolpyruvate-protein kinase (PTS system EI component)